MSKPSMSQRDRERALFRYRNALLRGDFDTVSSVLHLAESDSRLWQMLHELDEEEDAWLESDISDASLLNIIPYSYSSNGTSPKTHSKEDKIMTLAIPNRQTKPSSSLFRSVAAALLLLIFGAMLIIEITLPTGNNFGQVVELTQQPLMAGCQLTTTVPANEESLRLSQASFEARILQADEVDNELAMLLGICALQTAYTVEADDTLQAAMLGAGIVSEFEAVSRNYQIAQFLANGQYILTTNANSLAGSTLWDIATETTVRVFPNNGTIYTSVVASVDGQYVLNNIESTVARLWQVETGAAIQDFHANIEITSLDISPDGRKIAIGLTNGQVQLWDVATANRELTLLAHSSNPVSNAVFSPDSSKLLTSGNGVGNYLLQLWDVETGEKIREFPELIEPQPGIFSPDGQYVIAGGRPTDPRAVMWDAETGEEIRIFLDLSDTSGYTHVQAFAFSPDGRYVLIGSAIGTTWLFEVETGIELRQFKRNPSYTTTVDFSPDGRQILIAGGGIARIWSTDYRDSIADACRGLSRDFTAEERALYGLRDEVPTCPQFAEGYALEAGMTAIPTQPIPVWTALPTMESAGE
jgi:WD40 repeat protein